MTLSSDSELISSMETRLLARVTRVSFREPNQTVNTKAFILTYLFREQTSGARVDFHKNYL